MEQVTSQTSVSRELRSWVEEKAHSRLKHGGPEHSGNAHTKPGTPRNKKKSKQALHNVGLRFQTHFLYWSARMENLAGLGRARWDSLERLECLVWLSQPRSIWQVTPDRVEILTAHGSLWPQILPLLTAGKFIFRDLPISLTLPWQRVRSYPAITTLVLRQLFILFHLGLVAHAHWSRALLLIPPPTLSHGSVPFSFCWRQLHQAAGVGGGVERRHGKGFEWWVPAQELRNGWEEEDTKWLFASKP